MGKVLSLMGRPIRDFNVESRAHKVVSKTKPNPAPRHNPGQFEQMLKEYPEAYEESLKKHKGLDDNLRNVFVVSHDHEIKQQDNPDRPLPLSKMVPEDNDYGFVEPSRLPPGKTTLRKALEFISNHQINPKLHTVTKISDDYRLSEETVENVLKYFKVYEVYLPQTHKTNAKFAGPSIPRIEIIKQKPPKLPAGPKKKNDT